MILFGRDMFVVPLSVMFGQGGFLAYFRIRI